MLNCLVPFRSPSKRYARRTVAATTRAAILEEHRNLDGYAGSPNSRSMDSYSTVHVDVGGGRLNGSTTTAESPMYTPVNTMQTPVHRPPVSSSTGRANIPNLTSLTNSISPSGGTPSVDSQSFQHNNIRSTLPMDYRTNNYTGNNNRNSGAYSDTPQELTQLRVRSKTQADAARSENRLSRSGDGRPERRHSRTYETRSNNRGSRSYDSRVNSATDHSTDG